MSFQYNDYQHHLRYLAPADQDHFKQLMTNQNLVTELFGNEENLKTNLRKHEINSIVCLEYLVITQFLDPLIEKLEKSTEDEKKDKIREFDNEYKRLKIDRDKILNDIRRNGQGTKVSFKDFQGVINARLGDNGHSFAYHNYGQLQDIIKDIAKVNQEKESIPFTVDITPDISEYSNTSDEFKYKQIIESALRGAALAGVKPEQIIIEINGVKQTPENNAAYKSCLEDANKKIEEKIKSVYPGCAS